MIRLVYFMQVLNAFEVLPPVIEIIMRDRACIDSIFLNKRMRFTTYAMDIKFLL
jgi:hypothetical protein